MRLRRWVAAGSVLALLAWALQPSLQYWRRSQTEILVDQLLGRGCQYQDPETNAHTLNPLTEWSVRHPEFACPLWAAEHLERLRGLSSRERATVLRSLDEALARLPERFDTGDGVIEYGARIRKAREAIQRGRSPHAPA